MLVFPLKKQWYEKIKSGEKTTEKNIFPEIGKARDHAFEAIRHFQELGHHVVLWTCREGEHLVNAINWLLQNNIKMDGYNANLYPIYSKKIVADVYIDDKNVFMVDDVDWYKIEEYILGLGNKETTIIKDGYNG